MAVMVRTPCSRPSASSKKNRRAISGNHAKYGEKMLAKADFGLVWMKQLNAFRAVIPGLGLALALAVGIALRFIHPMDIEWKDDERWIFSHAQLMVAGGQWPWLGMATSMGPPFPGMSLWVFAGLFAVFGVTTPPDLARAVQSFNAAALVAFVTFALVAVPKERREYWLWAAALWAVNPLAVIFERKIWLPSVLPLATIAFIAAWWFRRNAGSAFAWGLVGALMAQVHLGVGFLAVAVAVWTLCYDRDAFPWPGWLAGSVIGVLPAMPWLFEMLRCGGRAGVNWRGPIPGFFLRWITQPFGFGIEYTLGPRHMLEYLGGPVITGRPTYLMALIHLILAALLLVILIQAIRAVRFSDWSTMHVVFLGERSETVLITATLWGYGGVLTLLTIAGVGSNRHYLIVATPVMALWTALAVFYGDQTPDRRRARALLVALCVGQAALSIGLIDYIHHRAVIMGEYGATWQAQQPGFIPPAMP
jgi:hypothetical protein